MMMELHGDKVERKALKVLASIDEMKEICRGKEFSVNLVQSTLFLTLPICYLVAKYLIILFDKFYIFFIFSTGIADPDADTDKLFGLVRQFYRWLFDVYEQTGEKKYRENEGDLVVKLERAKIKQAETYIRPLFKSLKKKTLDETLLRSFGEIGGAVLEKDYIGANDVYLRTAIGNAAWPIGVTMVGIHARTGREKLFAHNVAHVLNDEFQRKYLQAIKRLVTFAQRHFPTDPSKCVEYNA